METVRIVTRQGCVNLISGYVEREDRTCAAFCPDSLNTVLLAALLSATAWGLTARLVASICGCSFLLKDRAFALCATSTSHLFHRSVSLCPSHLMPPTSVRLSACVCVYVPFPSVAALPFVYIGYQAAVCTWAVFLQPSPTTTIVSPPCLLITPCQPHTCDTQSCKHRQAPFADKYLTPDEQGCQAHETTCDYPRPGLHGHRSAQ